MMVLSEIARSNTSPLTVNDRSRLRRRVSLIRGMILRLGIGDIRLILHLLLILISRWSGVCEICWSGNTWWTDIVGTTVLSWDGSQMRDGFMMDGGSGGGADLVVGSLVSLVLLLGVERWRCLVVKSCFPSMTILTNVRIGCTCVEYHTLVCQLGWRWYGSPLTPGGGGAS